MCRASKELCLQLPDGESHTFTLDTHTRRPPMFLVDPSNPKCFRIVDKLEIDILAPVDGEWPAVALQVKTKVFVALNVLLLTAAVVGLVWTVGLLLS